MSDHYLGGISAASATPALRSVRASASATGFLEVLNMEVVPNSTERERDAALNRAEAAEKEVKRERATWQQERELCVAAEGKLLRQTMDLVAAGARIRELEEALKEKTEIIKMRVNDLFRLGVAEVHIRELKEALREAANLLQSAMYGLNSADDRTDEWQSQRVPVCAAIERQIEHISSLLKEEANDGQTPA